MLQREPGRFFVQTFPRFLENCSSSPRMKTTCSPVKIMRPRFLTVQRISLTTFSISQIVFKKFDALIDAPSSIITTFVISLKDFSITIMFCRKKQRNLKSLKVAARLAVSRRHNGKQIQLITAIKYRL